MNKVIDSPTKSSQPTPNSTKNSTSSPYYLGKRSKIKLKEEDLLSDSPLRDAIKKSLIREIEEEENYCMDFMKENRRKIEQWKTEIILRNTKKVSFKIDDIGDIDSKVCDIYPRMDLHKKKYYDKIEVKKTKLFEMNHEDLERETLKVDLSCNIWSIKQVIDFAIYHVTEINNGVMYVEMLEDPRFSKRNLAQLLELHKHLKIPFK